MIKPFVPSDGHATMASHESGSADNRVLLTWGGVGNELVIVVERRE